MTEGFQLKLILSFLLLLRIFVVGYIFAVFAIHFPAAWKKRKTFTISCYFAGFVFGLGILLGVLKDIVLFL